MGLSTERKVFVGLLAVAGVALVIDQGFMGPSEASAGQAPPPSPASDAAPASSAVPVAQGKASGKPAAAILIERLKTRQASGGAAPKTTLGAAFTLAKLIEPAVLVGADAGAGAGADAEPGSALPVIRPRATDLPQLTAAMPASNGGGAVLNGKLVRAGQVGPNGYRLVSVKARSVVVEKGGVRYTVDIPTQQRP